MRAVALVLVAACGGTPPATTTTSNEAPKPTASSCPPELVKSRMPRTLYELGATTDRDLVVSLVATSGGWMVEWSGTVDLREPGLAAKIEALTGVKPEERVSGKQVSLNASWGDHELDATWVGTEVGRLSHACRLDGTSFTALQARAFIPELYPPAAEQLVGDIVGDQPLDAIIASVETTFSGEIQFRVRGTKAWRAGIDAKLAARADGPPIETTGGAEMKSYIGEGPPGWKIDVNDDGEITVVELDWSID